MDSFPVHRLEVVNTGRRRRWTRAEKLRIVEESFQGYRQVSATARRHEITPGLLFQWRKAFGRPGGGAATVAEFVPALIVPQAAASAGAGTMASRMEVVTATNRRIVFGADVDAQALARVVAALEAL